MRVVAGSPGMTGAAHLAAGAAQRAGSGMVSLSSPGVEPSAPPEVVRRRLPAFDWSAAVLDDLHRYQASSSVPASAARSTPSTAVRATVAGAKVPVVIDGDGLFAMAWNPDGAGTRCCGGATHPTVLTPHDGEFGLLAGHRPGADRFAAARRLAADTGAVVCSRARRRSSPSPGGDVRVVASGDARLATAGTGDVLAGILGALLATGMAAFDAASAGAVDPRRGGPARGRAVGLVAGDLLDTLPTVLEPLG